MRVARHPLLVLPCAALLALSLAACTSDPDMAADTAPPATVPADAAPAPATPGDTPAPCNAEAAQSFVGKEASQSTVAEAKAAAGANDMRVIEPGQPVTMDYRVDRLNVDVDEGNVIARIHCG